MATTQLSNLIVPDVFRPYWLEKTAEKSALMQSGVIQMDAELANVVASGGRLMQVPVWRDLGSQESNISSDDPAEKSTPYAMNADKDQAIRHNRNQSWSSMDLAAQLAGDDPMKRVAERVADYWTRDQQRTLIASLNGVMADNIANNGADMVIDIANDAASAPLDSELISAEAILDACQTLGDSMQDLAAIAMHSVCYTRLRKENLIDFIPNSEGMVSFPTYMGLTVIIDDMLPAIVGSNRVEYTSILFKAGAIAFAEGNPRVPVETFRNPDAGNGSGEETLYTRRESVMHPRGVKFTDSTVTGISPTNAELANAANWSRVYERKNIGMAFLKTNG